ncbi:hypothetical protein L2E82_19253 [Cichorium intybus]|uniref:Uncharacterized protein n=1 Tax=Cichorium intybus TaxID=13427 RepID=A0ACB9FBM1_CICIN|nr:hypothetical protein L2E82_19253 [Cichorium intybus]
MGHLCRSYLNMEMAMLVNVSSCVNGDAGERDYIALTDFLCFLLYFIVSHMLMVILVNVGSYCSSDLPFKTQIVYRTSSKEKTQVISAVFLAKTSQFHHLHPSDLPFKTLLSRHHQLYPSRFLHILHPSRFLNLLHPCTTERPPIHHPDTSLLLNSNPTSYTFL